MARLRSTKARLDALGPAERKAVEAAVADMASLLKDLVGAIRLFARNEASAESVTELVRIRRSAAHVRGPSY